MFKEYQVDTLSVFAGDFERMPRTLANHRLMEVAAAAHCNPQTVRTYLQGAARRRSVIDNIEAALKVAGLSSFVTPQGAYPNAPIASDGSSSTPESKT